MYSRIIINSEEKKRVFGVKDDEQCFENPELERSQVSVHGNIIITVMCFGDCPSTISIDLSSITVFTVIVSVL